ncbi:MAG: HRDC domain-containing protein [Microbacteriaceae bacterium]
MNSVEGGAESHPVSDVPAQALHEHVTVIETRSEYLRACVAIAAGTGPIAIDAERASGYRYSQRAYLVQIYRTGAGTFLFDPPAIGQFSELNDVISGEEWILHAASQDLTCLREIGLNPTRLYDTELAARLAGLPRVGLGTVVENLLGIHLAKEHSAADWSTRPLPQSWLVYAALDVELLVDLRHAMGELLASAGKTHVAEQEFESVLSRDFAVVRPEPWRRLTGLNTIRSPRNLAVARELWLARDAYAREIDTAPGRLVPDLSLSAAARVLPTSKKELAALKEFTGRASRTQIDRWWAAIEAGIAAEDLPKLRVPSDSIPQPRSWAEKNPAADRRLKAARAALQTVSTEREIPVENLLTPDTLRKVAWLPPVPTDRQAIAHMLTEAGARPWQIEATAQNIYQAFVDAAQESDSAEETPS